VKVEKEQWEAGGSEIDRLLSASIARISFGDSTAKRRDVMDDAQLRRSLELLRNGPTQRALFDAVQKQQTASANR
jgi:hypothetical protein